MARQPFNPYLIKPRNGDKPRVGAGPLTVSQVTALVKQAIETALPATIHVVGEISNYKRHTSGHLYFTLKDRASELACVMWRSSAAALEFTPTDGLEVLASGTIEVFERAGRYQLYARKLEPRGVGALELAFRQLCEKLSAEGLFDEDRKKRLPAYPKRIALVTSPTGAAVADLARTIERRYPCASVLLYPVPVQGRGAAQKIAAAIRRLNARSTSLGGIDIIIVGRGGGSLEDLSAFNEEVVARAISSSRIPVISAVGHEVDVTISDLVADVRGATPTAAGELAVPVLDEVIADLDAQQSRLERALRAQFELLTARVSGVLSRSSFAEPAGMVHRREQLVDELSNRMHRSFVKHLQLARSRLDELEPVIQTVAPHAYLLKSTVSLREGEYRLRWAVSTRCIDAERRVNRFLRRFDRVSPTNEIPRFAERFSRVADTLAKGMRYGLSLHWEHLRRFEQRLAASSHESALARGFSITRTSRGRKVVRSKSSRVCASGKVGRPRSLDWPSKAIAAPRWRTCSGFRTTW